MTCARPVSDCAACGSTVYLVEPVSTKRPTLVSPVQLGLDRVEDLQMSKPRRSADWC